MHKARMTTEQTGSTFLRRMADNLRKQNWIAVGVEFLIVVFGVFLGLQAANWNETRLERKDERAILERLNEEIGNLLEAVQAEGEELQSQVDRLVTAQPVLYSVQPERELTEAECRAIVVSHVYRKPLDEVPVLEEMLSTGRFDRLQNSELKRKLRSYILFRDRERGNHEERTNELFRLHSRYPDLITIELVPRAEGPETKFRFAVASANEYEWKRRCDIKGMRSNQAFLNELFDNTARNTNVADSNDRREEVLSELQELLATLLNS